MQASPHEYKHSTYIFLKWLRRRSFSNATNILKRLCARSMIRSSNSFRSCFLKYFLLVVNDVPTKYKRLHTRSMNDVPHNPPKIFSKRLRPRYTSGVPHNPPKIFSKRLRPRYTSGVPNIFSRIFSKKTPCEIHEQSSKYILQNIFQDIL